MRPRALLSGLVVFTLVTGSGVAASAHPVSSDARQREVEEQIRDLRRRIGEASAEEAAVLSALEDTHERLDAVSARVRAIDSDLTAANARLATAESEVGRLDAQYVAATRQLQDTVRRIDIAQAELEGIAAAMYRQAGGGQVAAFAGIALGTGTPHELFAAGQYLGAAADDRRAHVDELNALKARVLDGRDELEAQRDAARAARDVVARERAVVAGLKAEQERSRNELAGAQARQGELVDEIRAKKDQYEAEVARLQAESSRIADLLRGRQGGQVLVPSGSGVLAIPVGGPITGGFGMRRHPILGTTRMHNGIDISAGSGTPIRAAGDGEVVWASARGGYGNTVIIDHGNALATLYAHQSSVAVSVGATVSVGEVVGYVGSTGFSTGPHLHFEVRVRGTPVDPLQYL